jgi:hypothetical protein
MLTQVGQAKITLPRHTYRLLKSRIAEPMDVIHVLQVSFLWLLEFVFPKKNEL